VPGVDLAGIARDLAQPRDHRHPRCLRRVAALARALVVVVAERNDRAFTTIRQQAIGRRAYGCVEKTLAITCEKLGSVLNRRQDDAHEPLDGDVRRQRHLELRFHLAEIDAELLDDGRDARLLAGGRLRGGHGAALLSNSASAITLRICSSAAVATSSAFRVTFANR